MLAYSEQLCEVVKFWLSIWEFWLFTAVLSFNKHHDFACSCLFILVHIFSVSQNAQWSAVCDRRCNTSAIIPPYYLDTSVLLENTPLVKPIRNYIRDVMTHLPFIHSLLRILMTSFPAFFMVVCRFFYIIYNEKTLRWLEDTNLCFRVENNSILTSCARS